MNERRHGPALVELMIVLAVVALVAAFAIPSMMRSRMSANETAAVGTLRTLMSAETAYINRHGVFGTLAQLWAERLIDSSLAQGKKSGYFFGALATGSDYTYCFGAVPVNDGSGGRKKYCVTQRGAIYEATLGSTMLKPAEGEVDWIAGSNCPTEFTTHPEESGDHWKRISD